MAVVNTTYTPLNSDEAAARQAEKDAQFGDITADLSNQLLTGELDLTGLSSMSANDLYNPNHWQDMWNEDESHFMHSEHLRTGGGMDNAYNSGYTGHSYVGDDGRRYRKIVSVDQENDQYVEQYTDERMYRWQSSDEHKRTSRDSGAAEAAYGKEFQGNGGGGWYTEEEIRGAWDAGDMRQMQEQGVTWDQYWGYVTGIDDLIFSGELDYKDASNWTQNESYMALVNGLGIPLQFENRGDVYNFNGFGYSRDYWSDKTDVSGAMLAGIAMSAIGGFVVGPLIAGALTPALGAAGAKAAAGAITKLAQGYMQTGELQWEDALMSAALSYGGSQLSEALEGSGVLGEIGDKINAVGDAMGEGGGAVLNAALQAGGMSLVTQMVKDGEIDWKDAAVAAAMAGGTALLTSYLSDIGKSDAEGEVLEEIKVTAQRKGVQVGDGLYRLEDGTVISDTGNVLGNMSNLDLDGDGMLNANDLQDIDVNHDYVSTTPNTPQYTDYDGGGNAFREGGTYYVSEDGVVHQRGDVTYVDGGPNGTYLVRDAQGNEFYVKDATYTAEGRFVDGDGNYVAVNGYYDGASGNVYDNIEDYTTPNAITDNTGNQTELTYGRNPNWNNDPNYRGTVYGGEGAYGVNGEMDVFYDPTTNTYYTSDTMGNKTQINVNELPEDIQDKINTDSGNKPTGEDNNSPDTGADNQSTSTGTAGGDDTNAAGGNGEGGSSGGASLPGGNQDSTGNAGGGGNTGGGTTGVPDFSNMTPAEIAAWWASSGGFGNPGGGSTGSGSNDNTSGNTTGSGGDGTTTGDNSGAGGNDGAGGGGNSTNTEGGGGSDNTDGGGTGGGDGSGGGDGTGTGGHTDNTGGGDSGNNTGAGTGSGGGAGAGGGTDGTEGGGTGGDSGGGTDGTSGGTGGGEGGGGEGGGGSGGTGNGLGSGNGMLSGGGRDRPEWGPLLQGYQFKARPRPEPTVGMRMFEELWKANKL